MNQRIREILVQCTQPSIEGEGVWVDQEKFAELIVQEHIKILQQEWYDLNNEPRPENETPRSIAMRVGRKGGIIALIGKIKKHFGIE